MPSGGIRTHNPSKRAAADPHLRHRGHGDRLIVSKTLVILFYRSVVIEDRNVCHRGYESPKSHKYYTWHRPTQVNP